MKIQNIMRTMAVSCLAVMSMSSCSDWLQVDMEDEIMEDKLFENNSGFVSSLNGVYAKMNENYSSTLSMGVIDVMAQYYDVRQNSNHTFYNYANYNFNAINFENTSGDLWTTQYALIANLNLLLEHCDMPDATIKPNYYPMVKGEALALRAMLHFDLLRIYGPVYSADTENETTIPYEETTSKAIQPLLPAKEVMAKVLRDLNDAAELLKDDRIRTEGVMNSDSEDPNESSDMRYRQYRLNYYAVQALLARAYLWMGNKTKAYEIATSLISENKEKEVFPWTPKANVQSPEKPNRIFSTEVMFSLYNTSRITLFDNYFKRSAKISNSLTFKGESLNDMNGKIPHFYSDELDLRRGDNMWSLETLEETSDVGASSTKKAICFSKYADVPENSIRYMIPLIRMSEIYLIAAECAPTTTEAIGYINELRSNRNCIDLEEDNVGDDIQQYITNEFAREMIGEGQLYFYYKRLNMDEVLSGTTFEEDWWTGEFEVTEPMDTQDYVWPLPKVEIDKRVTTEN